MSVRSIEGVWIVVGVSSDWGSAPMLVEGDDPWAYADKIDYTNWPDGYQQRAERFVANTSELDDLFVEVGFERNYRRDLRTRTLHNPCGCNGNGRHIDPDTGMSRLCYQCNGRGWYWQETTGDAS